MIYSLKEAQRVFLGSQEVSKIFLRGLEIFSLTPSVPLDPLSNYVTLLAHFNTDFSDSSTNNLQLSAKLFPAIPVINTSLFKYGGGSVDFELNNPGCYIETPFNEGLQFPGDFTVEMWYYPTSLSVDQCLYDASLPDQSPTRDNSFTLAIDTSGQMFLFHNGTPNFTTSNPTINTWNHIAISRSGSSLRVFLNGNVVLTLTNSVNFNRGGALISTITETLGSYTINGYLDDLRVTNGIARYTENFTSPTFEFPNPSDPYGDNVSLLLHMDGSSGTQTFTDSSTNNFELTAFGNAQIDASVKKFGNGAAYFDEGGDYIITNVNDNFRFNGDFTIEMWLYPLSFNTRKTLFDNLTFVTGVGISLFTSETEGRYEIISDNTTLGVSTIGPNLNQWNHVALVRTNNIIKIYSNGIEVLSINNQSNFNSGGCVIGATIPPNLTDAVWEFNGYIDELRITKGVARYTSNFVPQTAPFANPSNNYNSLVQDLLAYWSFDDSTFQPSFGNYTAVNDGGAWTVTGISRYKLAASLTLGQRIRVPQNLWNVRTNPLSYSVSFWVKPNQLANTGQETVLLGSCFGDMGFFFNLGNIAPQNFSDVFNQHVNFWLATGSGFTYKNVLVPYTTNVDTWYHITGTYDLPNETAKLYINGTLVGTTTGVLNNNCTNVGWTGFAMNGSPVGTTNSEYGNAYTFDMVGFWTRTLTDNEVQLLYTDYGPISDFIT